MRFGIGVIDIEVGVGNTGIDSDIVGIALTSIVEDVVEDMHCRGVLATEGTRGGLAGTGIERHRVEVHADVLGERVNPDTRRCQGCHCRTGEGNHIVVNRDTVDVRTFTVVDADASLATRLVVDKIDEVVVDMDMVAIGHIDTRQRLACQGRAGGNAVACDKERVGITDMDTLIPEVENVVIGNRDVVALGVVNRAYSIVTAVEQTVVDSDIVVLVAQKHQVGIRGACRGFLGTDSGVSYMDIGAAVEFEYVGKHIVSRASGIVGIEVNIVECNIVG